MRAGSLNQLVVIQSRQAGVDALGQPSTSWATLASVWANLKAAKGLETIKAGAEASTYKLSARIRKRTDITAEMRLVHDGKTYNIEAVLPDVSGGNDYVDLVCGALSV